MSIISKVGRDNLKVRMLIAFIYTILILGGVTMIYPLGLMVAGSMKGLNDRNSLDLIPAFLMRDDALFQRYLESKYGDDKNGGDVATLIRINLALDRDYLSISDIEPPEKFSQALVDDFDEFRRSGDFSPDWYMVGHTAPAALNFRAFKANLIKESGHDLDKLSNLLKLNFRTWAEVKPSQGQYFLRGRPPLNELMARTERFKRTRPIEDQWIFNIHGEWKKWTLKPAFASSLEDYNQKTGRQLKSWDDARISLELPTNPADRDSWESYIRKKLPFACLKIDSRALPSYQSYLKELYSKLGGIAALNKTYNSNYRTFEEIALPSYADLTNRRFQDFNRFVQDKASIDCFKIDCPTTRYVSFLKKRFHDDISEVRRAYAVNWNSFEEVEMPIIQTEWNDLQKNKARWRWEFVSRNYSYVFDYMTRLGPALPNTIILCLLMIFTHLIFNPLAAYGLSRFGLPSTYKILLFFMATMAFPGEVIMIPQFLQLKEFGLLNTLFALVVPGMVSAFHIFLLKGFFDSLPKELYEAGMIDGASEPRMFWSITLPLSKPILAVNALASFTAAYSAFYFALIICPDPKSWTLMVWLYKLQESSNSQSINYAALCLAAVPTLLVFTFCQRIILRGIVVPVEK